ncbi:hypothetical protein MIDIC_490038 [Alphaproteobacteria bacterium]
MAIAIFFVNLEFAPDILFELQMLRYTSQRMCLPLPAKN